MVFDVFLRKDVLHSNKTKTSFVYLSITFHHILSKEVYLYHKQLHPVFVKLSMLGKFKRGKVYYFYEHNIMVIDFDSILRTPCICERNSIGQTQLLCMDKSLVTHACQHKSAPINAWQGQKWLRPLSTDGFSTVLLVQMTISDRTKHGQHVTVCCMNKIHNLTLFIVTIKKRAF